MVERNAVAFAAVGGAGAGYGAGAVVGVDEGQCQPSGQDWLHFREPVVQVASIDFRPVVIAAAAGGCQVLKILWSGRRIELD